MTKNRLQKLFISAIIVHMESTNGVTTTNILNITRTKASRIALVESDTPDAFQKLLREYCQWHFDDSLCDAARLLLSTELGWEQMPQLTTPPVGEVISPLGYALAHADKGVREAALQVLDATVRIPAGTAFIGEECAPLAVDEFEMSVYPVTNAHYQRFIQETGYEPPQDWIDGTYPENRGDHPVVWVTYEEAEAYARYAGGRLPTFPEWQYAARGTDDRLFPWGYEIDKPRCNTTELGAEGTTPVGAFRDGVSPFGCYDMMGNVWEWTSTAYDEEENFRVACGGAWYYNHQYSTCTSYDFFSTNYAEFVIGFRIAH